MIVYPNFWNIIGRHVGIQEIETRLRKIVWGMGNSLSLSGGVDSSLLLYYMCLVREPIGKEYKPVPIKVFTAARSMKHPDIVYAGQVVEYFRDRFKHIDLKHYVFHVPKNSKNGIKLFYKYVAKRTEEIIAGDGIDEFMGGYYDHQFSTLHNRSRVYHYHIRNLQKDHLIPLNENSGKVRVFLPYIDESLINLYSQIPLGEKVDSNARKKLMVAMAKGKVPDEVLTRRKYGFCDVS